MKTKLFIPLIALLSFGVAACGNTNPSGGGGSQGGGGSEPPSELEALKFSDTSFTYDQEKDILKVFYTLQTTEVETSLRLYGSNHLEVSPYQSGKAIFLGNKEDGLYDGEYEIILMATSLSPDYSWGDEYRFKEKLVINHPVREEQINLTNVKLGEVTWSEGTKEKEYVDRGYYTSVSFDEVTGHSVPFIYLFDENDKLVQTFNAPNGQKFNMGNLATGTYHFTIQIKGRSLVDRDFIDKVDYLNSEIIAIEETFHVEHMPEREPDPIIETLRISDLNVDHNKIASWDPCYQENVSYKVRLLDKNNQLVYEKDETTWYHRLDMDQLEVGETYTIKVYAHGDPKYYENSNTLSYTFIIGGNYDYPKGDNYIILGTEIKSTKTSAYIHFIYQIQNPVTHTYINLVDNETEQVLDHISYTDNDEGEGAFDIRKYGGHSLRVEVLAYDENHEYKDAYASRVIAIPEYEKLASITDITVKEVDGKFEIEATTDDGVYDKMELKYYIQTEDGEEEVRLEMNNGKIVVDGIDLEEGQSKTFHVSLYYDDEFVDTESFSYYKEYVEPEIIVVPEELECDFSQKIVGRKRQFIFDIKSDFNMYPSFSFALYQGNQPIIDEFIGSPNFDHETETYSKQVIYEMRVPDLKSGQEYDLAFTCRKVVENGYDEEGGLMYKDVEMVYKTTFVAL